MAVRPTIAAVACVGMATLLTGTFLPWLQSGRATRNSYETSGTVRRLIVHDGVLSNLFRFWPALGIVCALAVALYVFGLHRVGLAVAAIAALAGGAASIAALNAPANAYASVIDSGPVTTLVGAVVVLTGTAGHVVADLVDRRQGGNTDDAATA